MRTQATCDALRRLLPAIRRRLQPAKEIRKRWKPRRPLFFFLSLRCRIEEKDRSLWQAKSICSRDRPQTLLSCHSDSAVWSLIDTSQHFLSFSLFFPPGVCVLSDDTAERLSSPFSSRHFTPELKHFVFFLILWSRCLRPIVSAGACVARRDKRWWDGL